MSRYLCILQMFILSGCFLWHSLSLAAEKSLDRVSAGLPQVIQFEATDTAVTRCILKAGGIKSSGKEIDSLKVQPDVFLRTLGHYYLGAQRESPERAGVAICDGKSVDIKALLGEIDAAFLPEDYKKAKRLLNEALKGLPCDSRPISAETLGRLYFLSGLVKLRLQEQKDGSYIEDYRRAARISPSGSRLELRGEESRYFNDALKGRLDGRAARVSFEDLDLMEGDLRVDGRSHKDGPTSLEVGPHFLQVLRADGTVAAATIAEVPADVAPASVWTPSGFLPPKHERLREMLKGFTLETKDSTLEKALNLMQKEQNLPWILLVGLQQEGAEGDALLLPMGKGLERIPVSQCQAKRSSLGIGLTIASSAVTVVSTGVYGYYYYQGVSSPHTSVEAKQILQGVGIGRIGMIVGGAATIAAGSITWKIPAALYRSKPQSKSVGSAVWFGVGQETFAFGVKGEW